MNPYSCFVGSPILCGFHKAPGHGAVQIHVYVEGSATVVVRKFPPLKCLMYTMTVNCIKISKIQLTENENASHLDLLLIYLIGILRGIQKYYIDELIRLGLNPLKGRQGAR